MNSFTAGIDLGEKESDTTYLAPDGDIKENFKFSMDREGYKEFAKKIPLDTRIVFEASGSFLFRRKCTILNRRLQELHTGNILSLIR